MFFQSRRGFLSAALVGLSAKSGRGIAGGFVNESQGPGHRLRSRGPFRAPVREERARVVIVGGGIAGLSAAWWLARQGFRDFVLLEMEAQPGGVARWGENEITAYPWGAHYVPGAGQPREAGADAVRGPGGARRRRVERAPPLLFAAGAAVPARAMAGGAGAGDRAAAEGRGAVAALRGAHRGVPAFGGVHDPDGRGRAGFRARPRLDGGLAARAGLRFALPRVVRELRLP